MDLVVDASVWLAAAIPSETESADSRGLLALAAEGDATLHVPALARIEIACAFARRFQDAPAALRVVSELLDQPSVVVHELDADLVDHAQKIGTGSRLRSADAVYAALADLHGWTLITWDRELIQRAGGVLPRDWTP